VATRKLVFFLFHDPIKKGVLWTHVLWAILGAPPQGWEPTDFRKQFVNAEF
jgi:hypothetical protein